MRVRQLTCVVCKYSQSCEHRPSYRPIEYRQHVLGVDNTRYIPSLTDTTVL